MHSHCSAYDPVCTTRLFPKHEQGVWYAKLLSILLSFQSHYNILPILFVSVMLSFVLVQTMDTDVVQLQTNLSNLQVKVAMLVDRFGHSVVRGVNYSTTLSGVTLAPKCNTTIEGPCQVESPRQDLGVVFSVVNCPSSQFDIAADEAATVSCVLARSAMPLIRTSLGLIIIL